jgi:surface antigen
VRPENFVGVGQQNFSQTNSDEAKASPKTEELKSAKTESQGNNFVKRNNKLGRYSFHAAAILAVIAVAVAGRIGSSQAISTKGAGSTKDQTSMITTGAILASSTKSVIAEDVAQKAQDLTNMSSLATSGEDFLSNRSAVLAAGAPSREIISYKVKEGDTLSTISAKFNITTDTIKWANDISNEDSIKPGNDLVILPVNGILHTSQDGDDVLALANKYQSNAALIENFNGLEGKAPTAGTKLIIPDGVKPAPVIPAAVAATSNRNIAAGASNAGSSFGTFKGGLANTYTRGQCTWYVASRRPVPSNWGNAISWYYNAQRAGFATGSAPRAGAIGWERSNHVVYVESVNSNGTVNISEMNWGGRPGVLHTRTEPASRFLYIY